MKYELANVNPYVNYSDLCIKLLVGTFSSFNTILYFHNLSYYISHNAKSNVYATKMKFSC